MENVLKNIFPINNKNLIADVFQNFFPNSEKFAVPHNKYLKTRVKRKITYLTWQYSNLRMNKTEFQRCYVWVILEVGWLTIYSSKSINYNDWRCGSILSETNTSFYNEIRTELMRSEASKNIYEIMIPRFYVDAFNPNILVCRFCYVVLQNCQGSEVSKVLG